MTPTAPTAPSIPQPAADPFAIGWRDVERYLPDGNRVVERVPLTEQDVLHPMEGDHVMNGPVHDADCAYLRNVFSARVAADPSACVFNDVGVYWDRPDLDHHSPDLTVVRGAPGVRDLTGMYHVADFGVLPALLVEVVSPSTRKVDLTDKFREYHEAGVSLYVIVDRDRPQGPPRLIGYQRTPRRYVPLPLEEDGRLWLEPVNLYLGVTDNRVVAYDVDTGAELGDYTAVSAALAVEQERADAERQRADAEGQRADAERQRADAERQRANAAETRLRELGAELLRRPAPPAQP